MSTNHRYTTNPLTGRTIRVGGQTFNQLVMESFDYLDGRLVRRANAPPLREREIYLNIDTGREVQFGTRTYFDLIRNAGYEIIEDYYLVPPRLAEVAQYNPDILHIQNTQTRLERLYEELERNPDYYNVLDLPVFQGTLEDGIPTFHGSREELARAFNIQLEELDRRWTNFLRERGVDRRFANIQRGPNDIQQSQLARLTELNLALCDNCRMPVKLDELPENGLCEDCNQEV
jgi:hypothetical protein